MQSSNPSVSFGYIDVWQKKFDEAGWWHSFELPNGQMIEGALTVASLKQRIALFPIPDDLTGKRVLDVGTWDGWFAFEMERRGAEVIAIDLVENPRFHEIREILGSRVDYRQLSVYDLDPKKLGRFDIVLFMGVLYHLKHPLLGLERVCAVANDLVAVDSFILQDRHRPGLGVEQQLFMEFYENVELGGRFDNWIAPTLPCLLALCRSAGFARVELNTVHDHGAVISCHRTWGTSEPRIPAARRLTIDAAFHTDNRGINFRSASSDEYVSCRINPEGAPPMTVDSVRPQVGGFGVRPVFVGMVEGFWQVNFKLPPGLAAGWHEVRVGTQEAESDPVEIAVDLPLTAPSLAIESVTDGVTWESFRVSRTNAFLSVWARGLPRNADQNNVQVHLGGKRQTTTFVGVSDADGIIQINARLNPRTRNGVLPLLLRFGEAESAAVDVEVSD